MSKATNPNLNNIGFVTDIVNALKEHMRGEAGDSFSESVDTVKPLILDFVERVDEALNTKYPSIGSD